MVVKPELTSERRVAVGGTIFGC